MDNTHRVANTVSHNFLRTIFEGDSGSESKSDSSDDEFLIQLLRLRGPREKPVRIKHYVCDTIPNLRSEQFRQHFRMTRSTYQRLETRLWPLLAGNLQVKHRVPVRVQLLATLWLLATPDSYRSVGERFDLSKGSLSASFMRVVTALNDIAGDIVYWPRGEQLENVKRKFRRLSALPDIIGAIDGSHVFIKQPAEDLLSYKCYKKRYSVILQAVCDSQLRFLDCFSGWPGSVGDLRAFINSDLFIEVERNRQLYFPQAEYIIGDKAYPVLSWCISGFRDLGNLTAAQIRFNMILSAVRQVIERAFPLLKGRFRRLKYLDMVRVDMIPFVINACTRGVVLIFSKF